MELIVFASGSGEGRLRPPRPIRFTARHLEPRGLTLPPAPLCVVQFPRRGATQYVTVAQGSFLGGLVAPLI